MDILMAIVIGFILVVAGYVGYYASQEVPAEKHDVSLELDTLNADVTTIQPLKQVMMKSIS